MNNTLKKIGKWALYILGGAIGFVLLILIGVFIAFQFSSVQTFVAGKATDWLSKKTGTVVRVGKLDIDFVKTVVLESVYAEDRHRDTLLYAGSLRVDIGLFALGQQKIELSQIELKNVVAKISKPADKDTFNFQFFIDAFASKDTTATPEDTTKGGWTFDVKGVAVRNVRFRMDDKFNGNYLSAQLGSLDIDLKTLGLDEKHPIVNRIAINGFRAGFEQTTRENQALEDSVLAKADTLADPNTKQPLNPSGWRVDLKRLDLDEIYAQYNVNGRADSTGLFDYRHMDVRDLELQLEDFILTDNDVKASLNHLALRERNSGAAVRELRADITVHEPSYRFAVKEFRTDRSVLNDGIDVLIPNLKDPANLTKTLTFTGNFRHDTIHLADVHPFAPVLDTIGIGKMVIRLDGQLAGKNHAVGAREFTASLNEQNRITLSGKVANYDDVPRIKLDELFHQIEISPAYIAKALPMVPLPPEVLRLRHIKYTGKASGTLAGFSGNGTLESPMGRIALERYYYRTDTAFKTHQGSARLRADGVQPSVMLGPGLGLSNVYLTADLDGGYSATTGPALRKGNVVVQQARYQGYTYRNLRLDATYLREVARAHLRYHDRNLNTDLHALANMGLKTPVFEAHGPIAANLRNLRLTTDTLSFSTRLDARIQGTDPNTMVGYATLRKVSLQQSLRHADLDSLKVTMGYDSSRRLIAIESEVIQARLIGRYDVVHIGDAITSHIAKYVPISGFEVIKGLPKQEFRLTAHIPANPAAIETAVAGLRMPQPLDLSLDFSNVRERFDTRLSVPDLRFNTTQIQGLAFNTDTKESRWDIGLKAQNVAQDSFQIPEPEVEFRIREGDAAFRLRIASDEADNRARLAGNLLSVGEITRMRLAMADLYLKKQRWNLDTNARMEFGANHLIVDHFVLENQEDSSKTIRVDLKEGYTKNAVVARISNIEIKDITRLLPMDLGYDLAGIIQLRADVADVFSLKGVRAQLALDSLAVNGNGAGRFTADVTQPSSGLVAVLAELANRGNKLEIKGKYNLEDTLRALDFRLTMDHFHPEEIAPILNEYVREWTGDMTADMTVKGRVANPRIEGFIRFNNPNIIEPAYTRVPYNLTDQQITFTNNTVRFDKFTLLDEAKNSMVIDGDVDITDLTAPRMALDIDGNNFHLINTRASDNESFYGTAFVSPHLEITGPANKLNVEGRVETEEGTKITYNIAPLEPGKAGKADWIIFKDTRNNTADARQDSMSIKDERIEVSGFGLSMRVRLKKGTRFTIIIDPKTGDQLQCEGTADLRLRLLPNGEVNLQGTYELTDGFYQMNLLGLIKKQFKVKDGSKLVWTGEPANANIDLTAAYETKTSRFELVADQAEAMTAAEVAAAKRRLPVQVLLKITNTIMQPDIKFDIVTPEEGEQGGSGVVAARLQQIRSNESELNKQALGLIAFNRFVSTGETQGTAGQSTSQAVNDKVNQTVSDVLSQQLSGLSQDYLGGVEINVNVNSNDYAGAPPDSREVGVSVSRNFINDRLNVSVGGLVTNATGSSGGGSSTPALGDVSATYRLDKKGNLNIKVFRTYTQGLYTNSNQERIGASLAHTKNFSSISKLFWGKERRERERKKLREEIRKERNPVANGANDRTGKNKPVQRDEP